MQFPVYFICFSIFLHQFLSLHKARFPYNIIPFASAPVSVRIDLRCVVAIVAVCFKHCRSPFIVYIGVWTVWTPLRVARHCPTHIFLVDSVTGVDKSCFFVHVLFPCDLPDTAHRGPPLYGYCNDDLRRGGGSFIDLLAPVPPSSSQNLSYIQGVFKRFPLEPCFLSCSGIFTYLNRI